MRFAVGFGPVGGSDVGGINGYAGVPPMPGLGAHYEVLVACRGEPDPQTGYFMDIKTIDRAVRSVMVPVIAASLRRAALGTGGSPAELGTDPNSVLAGLVAPLNDQLGGTLSWVRWMLTPTFGVEMAPTSPAVQGAASAAGSAPSPTATLCQRFEIAAAHRLHTPALSDEENRRYFGKCNNPSGHGHNYVIEVRVRVPVGPGRSVMPLDAIERAVDRAIIQPYDHTHLNLDTKAFASPGGLNPSVENISMVFFEALAREIASASGGAASLQCVTVFETEKTSSTYPALGG